MGQQRPRVASAVGGVVVADDDAAALLDPGARQGGIFGDLLGAGELGVEVQWYHRGAAVGVDVRGSWACG
ncbi:Uncharacterised protein [Mycobacteroides abscessus subsp. abscessus]|nr:Uncharacterised protein [Mycobacteroides abscessus subsp. abscessus]